MRALLLFPEYPETFWSFKHALKFIAKKAGYPPLGLLTIAGMLPPDWETKLIDLNVCPLRDEDLRRADIVLISAMSIQQKSAREIIERCQALGIKTMAGGPLFTATPEEFPDVDFLVLNEAEVTLPEFLDDFARGQARHLYTSSELADLTTTPVPRWELINPRHYASMGVQITRGCPFDCEFCNITSLFGRKPRMKSTRQVIAELDQLYALGWRGGVFFVDDNFIGPKKPIKEEVLPALLAWMKRRKNPYSFNAQVSLNLADDPALLDQLVRAGFATVFVGIESPNEESLAECNKIPNKKRDLISSIKIIQRAGLQVQGGFIVGFDNDPLSIFERLAGFIKESGIVTAMVGVLNAPNGTRLYQRLQSEGRMLQDMTGDNTDCSVNFIPKMKLEDLLQGYRSIMESIYSPQVYYQRVKDFLRNFHPRSRRAWKFEFVYLISLAKMMVTLGVIEKERTYYWRLLFWSLFRRPRLLPMALTLTAYGFHFRKCFEQYQAAAKS